MPLLSLLLTSACALSQVDLDRTGALALRLPDRVLFDAPGDGAQWALGRSYKASVDANGLRFLPFLGSDADGAARARFVLESISVGGTAPRLEPASVRREGSSLVLDRGPLVERYKCSMDAVEQVREVDLDGLEGALRVEFRVDTDLRRPDCAQAPFTFGGAEGAVRVGEAFVLPGDGSRIPVESTRTERGYAIVVPAPIVAAAGDSLVIDPLISSGVIGVFPEHPFVITDVASIRSSGYFFVVERRFNGVDGDLFVYRASPAFGSLATFVASIDFSHTTYADPAIAGTDSTDDLVVVATRDSGAARRVFARRTNASGTVVDPFFLVRSPDNESYSPDIGVENGGPFLLRRFVVVWNDVLAGRRRTLVRAIDRNGTVSAIRQVDDFLTNSSIPAVSNAAGEPGFSSPQTFRVAYKRTDFSGAESIWAVDVDRDGDIVVPRWQVADAELTERISVTGTNEIRLADGSSPYLIVWDSGPAGDGDIHAATCADGSVRGAISNLSAMSDERRAFDQRRPAVAATFDQWLVTYQDRDPLGDWSVYMCTGQPAPESLGLAERNVRLLAPGSPQTNPAIVTAFEGGAGGGSAVLGLAAWVNESGATSLEGAYFQSVPALGIAGVQYCEANRNSTGRRAWISVLGNGSVSWPHAVICSEAPAGTPCFILTSRQAGFVPNVAGSAGNLCLGGLGFGRFSNEVAPTGPDGRYTLGLDPQAIAQPNGTVAATVGETWYFQAWFRDSAQSVPTSNLSNGVAIEFGI